MLNVKKYAKIIRFIFWVSIISSLLSIVFPLIPSTTIDLKLFSFCVSILLFVFSESKTKIIESYLIVKKCVYSKILAWTFVFSLTSIITLIYNVFFVIKYIPIFRNKNILLFGFLVTFSVCMLFRYILKIAIDCMGDFPNIFLNRICLSNDNVISTFSILENTKVNTYSFDLYLSVNQTANGYSGITKVHPTYSVEERETKYNERYYIIYPSEYGTINNNREDFIQIVKTNTKLKLNIPIVTTTVKNGKYDEPWYLLDQKLDSPFYKVVYTQFKKDISSLYKSFKYILSDIKRTLLSQRL